MKTTPSLPAAVLAASLLFSGPSRADLTAGMVEGAPDLQSISSLAFGPGGILFVADPKGAKVFALATGDTSPAAADAILAVNSLDSKVAALLGTSADEILLHDLAVNPASGRAYLSVSRGKGPQAPPAIVRVGPGGTLELVSLDKVKHSSLSLDNAPEDAVTGEGRRRRNKRMESITDLAYLDGKVVIAGLSNEEFASSLRSALFPFEGEADTTSVEIFHGAHGRLETASPIRTFLPMLVGDKPSIVASYTCTPLVTLPIADLRDKVQVKGRTVAELGNRNRPLDMIEYRKDGKTFILIANSSRGVMKVSTEKIATIDAIAEKVSGGESAGLPYETIKDWEGITQLDKLGDSFAVVIRTDDGTQHLEQRPLP